MKDTSLPRCVCSLGKTGPPRPGGLAGQRIRGPLSPGHWVSSTGCFSGLVLTPGGHSWDCRGTPRRARVRVCRAPWGECWGRGKATPSLPTWGGGAQCQGTRSSAPWHSDPGLLSAPVQAFRSGLRRPGEVLHRPPWGCGEVGAQSRRYPWDTFLKLRCALRFTRNCITFHKNIIRGVTERQDVGGSR